MSINSLQHMTINNVVSVVVKWRPACEDGAISAGSRADVEMKRYGVSQLQLCRVGLLLEDRVDGFALVKTLHFFVQISESTTKSLNNKETA